METSVQHKVLSGYKQMASFLGVSTKTIQRHRKRIPILKLGKNNLILYSELIEWMRDNPRWKRIKKRK